MCAQASCRKAGGIGNCGERLAYRSLGLEVELVRVLMMNIDGGGSVGGCDCRVEGGYSAQVCVFCWRGVDVM